MTTIANLSLAGAVSIIALGVSLARSDEIAPAPELQEGCSASDIALARLGRATPNAHALLQTQPAMMLRAAGGEPVALRAPTERMGSTPMATTPTRVQRTLPAIMGPQAKAIQRQARLTDPPPGTLPLQPVRPALPRVNRILARARRQGRTRVQAVRTPRQPPVRSGRMLQQPDRQQVLRPAVRRRCPASATAITVATMAIMAITATAKPVIRQARKVIAPREQRL